MKPENLANDIEKIILNVTDTYAEEVIGIQDSIYNRLVRVLKDLELDSDGYIKQSAANRAILYKAESSLDELLPGQSFTDAVSRTISSINVIDELNVSYFSSISEGFNENRNFIKSLQAQTVESIEGTLLQDGLTSQIKSPLTDILNRNVNSGGQFNGFLEELRTFIKGNTDLDGRLLSYSRTHLTDSLFNYSRGYQESMTSDLKLDWYLYSGGLSDKSREFCIQRAGNYYHRKEIESWASQSWQGKRQGTTKSSIFIFLAGWNCKHSLIPVHDSIVPKEDLKRFSELK
jgi:hypothetical protein